MGKHAYLIIAHNEFDVLKCLLSMLDYNDNDIYLHIDKKVGIFDVQALKSCVNKSRLFILKNRVDVKWGNFSQIECELRLLEESTPREYEYYHLLSGVDLPLKSQKAIHDFFDAHNGTEYVQFMDRKLNEEAYERVAKYHFFAKRKKSVVEKILDKICLSGQFMIDRTKKSNLNYQKGANWFSITHELAKYVVCQRKLIKKWFSYTICGDEMFLQTLVASSSFVDAISPNNYCDNYETICYCIDWKRGNPYIFTMRDYELLLSSNQLFARKFSWSHDKEIIRALENYVMNKFN